MCGTKTNKAKVETSARFKIQYPMKNRIEYCKLRTKLINSLVFAFDKG